MNNSRKGKEFEYAVRDHLRERGYIAHLVSRSKPFDIVAWLPNSERAFIIECTTEKITPSKVKSFLANTEGIVAWRVLAEKRKGEIQFYVPEGFNSALVAVAMQWREAEYAAA